MHPGNGQIRARQDIAQVFEAYDLEMNIQRLVGTRVLPLMNVQLAHGTYPFVSSKELMRNPNTASSRPEGFALARASRSNYIRDDYAFDQKSYTTQEHGLEGVVDENERNHYSSHFAHEADTARWIRHRLLIQAEQRVVAKVFATSTFIPGTQSADAGVVKNVAPIPVTPVKWSDWANATPIEDFFFAQQRCWDIYGYYPMSCVMNERAYKNLRNCEQIRERIHSQGAGDRDRQSLISAEQIAQILDVDEIIVGRSAIDATNPNATSFVPSHLWGPHCLLFQKCDNSMRSIGLGHTLHWAADGSQPNGKVEEYYEPQNRGQILRIRHQTEELLKYPLGFLITNVI